MISNSFPAYTFYIFFWGPAGRPPGWFAHLGKRCAAEGELCFDVLSDGHCGRRMERSWKTYMNNDYIYNGNIWQYHVYGYVLNYVLNNDVTRLRENRSRSDFNEMCNECSVACNEMTGSLGRIPKPPYLDAHPSSQVLHRIFIQKLWQLWLQNQL